MNCGVIRAELSAFFDNELPETIRADVEAHLANCNACCRVLEEYKRLRLVVTIETEVGVELPGWSVIDSQLRKQVSPRVDLKGRSIVAHWQLIVVAMLACVLVGLISFSGLWKKQGNVGTLKVVPILSALRLGPDAVHRTIASQLANHGSSADVVHAGHGGNSQASERLGGHRLADEVHELLAALDEVTLVSTRQFSFPFCKCPEGECVCGPSGCQCTACIFERTDGSLLVLLENCNSQKVDFGDLPIRVTDVNGRFVQAARIDGVEVVSWKLQHSRRTAIGALSVDELKNLFAAK